MKKKLWKKTNIYLEVGSCRYCNEKIFNNDSFVSFLSKDHAHYDCLRKDDDLKQKVLQSVEEQLHQEKEIYAKR